MNTCTVLLLDYLFPQNLSELSIFSIFWTTSSFALTGYLHPSSVAFLRKWGLRSAYCISLSASLHSFQLLAINILTIKVGIQNLKYIDRIKLLLNSIHHNTSYLYCLLSICLAYSKIQAGKNLYYRNSVLSSLNSSSTDAYATRIILDLVYLTE